VAVAARRMFIFVSGGGLDCVSSLAEFERRCRPSRQQEKNREKSIKKKKNLL
jgi:hypothetical protein